MTPREPEPTDADRPSIHRRDHDRDDPPVQSDRDDWTTGQHRIAGDNGELDDRGRAERHTGFTPRGGRPEGAPPAPRRRRGTPPTHGLPVPPPPITKELVSDDVPRPTADTAGGGLTGNHPVSPAGSTPRHGDPDAASNRRSETGRHGTATSSHRAPDVPPERAGRFAGFRVPRASDADRDRHGPDARPAGGSGSTGAPAAADDDRGAPPTGDIGVTPDLRGFGGLRAGVARLGGARVGDALRQRGGSSASGGARRRFGGTGEQPTIDPDGRGGPADSSDDAPSGRAGARRSGDPEKIGRERRGFSGRRGSPPTPPNPTPDVEPGAASVGGPAAGARSTLSRGRDADDRVGGRPGHGGLRDRMDRRRSAADEAANRSAVSEPTSPLHTIGPSAPAGPSGAAAPGDRTTGAMRPVGPSGVRGGPTGAHVPGGGPTGTRTPGGGPTGTGVPMGPPNNGRPGGGPTGAHVPGGGPTGTRTPGGGPTGTGVPMGPPNNGRSGGGPTGTSTAAPGIPPRAGGRATGPMPVSPGAAVPGGGPSRPIGRGPQGDPQRGGPNGPAIPGGGSTGPVMPGGGSGPASQRLPDGSGRAVAAMPPTGFATATVPGPAGVVAPAPYAPDPYAPAAPRAVPPMSPGVMPAGPAESHAPIGVPPSAFAETAIVNLPQIDADSTKSEARDPSGGREVRYANQVHTRTSRGMIIAVLAVVVALIGAVPAFLLIAESSGNPDFAAINKLNVPSWAVAQPVDHTSGNRWCLSACLKSERTVASTHSVAETATAYTTALRAGGWTPAPANACPPGAKGVAQSCWVLDREQMNVLVTASACAGPPPPSTEPGLVDPSTPSTRASPPAGCAPTMVSISVFDRIDLRPATKTSQ